MTKERKEKKIQGKKHAAKEKKHDVKLTVQEKRTQTEQELFISFPFALQKGHGMLPCLPDLTPNFHLGVKHITAVADQHFTAKNFLLPLKEEFEPAASQGTH